MLLSSDPQKRYTFPMENSKTYTFDDLVEILKRLRAPDGCPWDREQDHQSLLKYLMEESVEVAEAVQSGDMDHVCEELGDVLLQVVFHAQIASEASHFSIAEVVHGISEKMVRRHPHVFGQAKAETSDQVLVQWDQIKAEEKKGAKPASVLDKVHKSLPALARAQELQTKAAKTGFDWPDAGPVFAKVHEELDELRHEIGAGNRDKMEEEYGDLLFAVAALGRKLGLEAELSLVRGNAKFERRFRRVEVLGGGAEGLKKKGEADLTSLWERVKSEE